MQTVEEVELWLRRHGRLPMQSRSDPDESSLARRWQRLQGKEHACGELLTRIDALASVSTRNVDMEMGRSRRPRQEEKSRRRDQEDCA